MDVYADPRVHPMAGANDGSYEIEKDKGGWAAFPVQDGWMAGRYSDSTGNGDLGPFATRDLAIQAVLER
jgi:hypothetical protein